MTETSSTLEPPRGLTVEQTIERLRAAILAGRLVPGQRLVVQDLTEAFSVGRGSLREALQRLSAEGLIEIIPNRGAVIRRLSRKQVRDLFEIRVNLEGLGARLAAERIREIDHRARFEEVWNEVKACGAAQPWHGFIQQNRLYHRTIVGISGNERLAELIDNLHLPIVMFQVGQAMGRESIERSHAAHVEIANAILAGAPDAAEGAMRDHVQTSADWILDLPDNAFRR
ncbi:GntR family transcriptional regulator [Methylobacterium mesophilicum SR1.6/6]|uniref:GntR family transcriptional regulator n=1 Tax=Methylobacterium mesophilicum SR1.6/6 TaxID=908290 RepID=A0A6B9FHX3_9HYPH|nr:GntR family transcriptional regulator [Methylobacterium mesophilicum]QGY01569.1 GntR family transcriptional regulator [Methylobacterium mesophilicum SR1.6/6]